MKLSVHNISGKETKRKVDLNDDIFGIEPNNHALYLDVKQYLAAQRSGTHKSKERSDVKGSRRKLRKQKGSGAARVGDIKNPIFRGGGRVFGPRVRDYNISLNSKTKKIAKCSALSYKTKDNTVKLEYRGNLEYDEINETWNSVEYAGHFINNINNYAAIALMHISYGYEGEIDYNIEFIGIKLPGY